MAKFSFTCKCFKSGEIGGLDKHNRRLNDNYISNPDIKTELSEDNRIYIAPKQSLYKDCKEQIEKRVIAHGGRITKASNWLCECVFSYPDELPLERLDEYNDLIIRYMNSRFDNMVVSAICHLDEGGLPHLHLDILPITETSGIPLPRSHLLTACAVTPNLDANSSCVILRICLYWQIVSPILFCILAPPKCFTIRLYF